MDSEKEKIRVVIECSKCKELQRIDVFKEDYEKFKNSSELIQNIFPYLSPGEREMFKTQICDSCFKKMFEN